LTDTTEVFIADLSGVYPGRFLAAQKSIHPILSTSWQCERWHI